MSLVLVAGADAAGGPLRCKECWTPRPTTKPWQLQLQGKIAYGVTAPVFDIDGLDNGRRTVRRLHRRGARVVCYFSAGSWERWRADADEFPREARGHALQGWPGERWLDIRRIDLIGPPLVDRMRTCKRRGYDGVDPDNVDGYRNDTGFPLTSEDQLTFNRWLADEAHRLGLSVGLKNDVDQVDELLPWFDFHVNEQCFLYRECGLIEPFVRANKAVFNVEYELPRARFCARARKLQFSSIRKRLDLRARRWPC